MQCTYSSDSKSDSDQMDAFYASLKKLIPETLSEKYCFMEERDSDCPTKIQIILRGPSSEVLLFAKDMMSYSFKIILSDMLLKSGDWYVCVTIAYLVTDKTGKINLRTKANIL
jgi:hypothetical protein